LNQTSVRRSITVTDHFGVDLLLKLTVARRRSVRLGAAEHTLGTAATELEMPASSLSYYVTRFVRAGLVEVVRREPRAGKPIPVNRCHRRRVLVPFEQYVTERSTSAKQLRIARRKEEDGTTTT